MPSIVNATPSAPGSGFFTDSNLDFFEINTDIPLFGRALDSNPTLAASFNINTARTAQTTFTDTQQVAYTQGSTAYILQSFTTFAAYQAANPSAGVGQQFFSSLSNTNYKGNAVTAFADQHITTFSCTGSTNTITVASATGLVVGQIITSAGVNGSGSTSITNIAGNVITMASTTTGTQSGTSITFECSAIMAHGIPFGTSGTDLITWTPPGIQARNVDSGVASISAIAVDNKTITMTMQTTGGSNAQFADLQPDDVVIIANLRGGGGFTTNVGNWEFAKIGTSFVAGTIVLDTALTKLYGDTDNTSIGSQKVIIQRVPEYNAMIINSSGILTASAFNGTWGGLLPVMAVSLTCNGTGKVSADAIGYRGGATTNPSFPPSGPLAGGRTGAVGEGYAGDNTVYGSNTGPGSGGRGGGIAANGGSSPGTDMSSGGGASGGAGGGGYGATGGTAGNGSAGGGSGGVASSTGVVSAGGAGGVGPTSLGGTPASGPTTQGGIAGGNGGTGAPASPNAGIGGSSVGNIPLSTIYMGGGGGASGGGQSGGRPQQAPNPGLLPPGSNTVGGAAAGGGYTTLNGGSGGAGPAVGGGIGGGIVLLMARTITTLTASSQGGTGSAGGTGGTGVSFTPGSVQPVNNGVGGAGGGAGGGGSGGGGGGTIYVFAQSQTITAVPAQGGAGGAGGTGGSGGNGAHSSVPTGAVGGALGAGGAGGASGAAGSTGTTGGPSNGTPPGGGGGGGGSGGGGGGIGAGGRVKIVYLTTGGVYASNSVDGPAAPFTPAGPIVGTGFKQSL